MWTFADKRERSRPNQLWLGFDTSIGKGQLRETLDAFGADIPGVEIGFVEGERAKLFSALDDNRIDIAIAGDIPLLDSGCQMPLWEEPLIAVLSPRHPLAGAKSVRWTDMKKEEVIFAHGARRSDVSDAVALEAMVSARDVRVGSRCNSGEGLKFIAGLGGVIGITNEACAFDSYPGVVYIPIHDEIGPARIGFSAHWRRENDSPCLGRFIELLERRYPPDDKAHWTYRVD